MGPNLFDYAGEREYYARPITTLRDWRREQRDVLHE
jgi:hypothetical protein